jgi:hypothetical protein
VRVGANDGSSVVGGREVGISVGVAVGDAVGRLEQHCCSSLEKCVIWHSVTASLRTSQQLTEHGMFVPSARAPRMDEQCMPRRGERSAQEDWSSVCRKLYEVTSG